MVNLKELLILAAALVLSVTVVFGESSELISTIAILAGCLYLSFKEANADFQREISNKHNEHGVSSAFRIVGVFLAMIYLDFHMHLYWSYFLWNMGMFLGAYSFFFNARLSWLRGNYLFEYLYPKRFFSYDNIFYLMAFKNGSVAGVLKVLFDFSTIPALFLLNHFGMSMPEKIIYRP